MNDLYFRLLKIADGTPITDWSMEFSNKEGETFQMEDYEDYVVVIHLESEECGYWTKEVRTVAEFKKAIR